MRSSSNPNPNPNPNPSPTRASSVASTDLPTSPYISLHLPTSAYISLHLPTSPYTAPVHLRASSVASSASGGRAPLSTLSSGSDSDTLCVAWRTWGGLGLGLGLGLG